MNKVINAVKYQKQQTSFLNNSLHNVQTAALDKQNCTYLFPNFCFKPRKDCVSYSSYYPKILVAYPLKGDNVPSSVKNTKNTAVM